MAAQPQHFKAGQYLFKEGDRPDAIYLIQTGTVGIRKKKGGGYVEIARAHQNEVIGELSFFDRQPRSASAVAISNLDVLRIDFESFESIFKKVPTYFRTIIGAMAERLRKANDKIRQAEGKIIQEDEGVDKNLEAALDATSVIEELDSQIDSSNPGSGADDGTDDGEDIGDIIHQIDDVTDKE